MQFREIYLFIFKIRPIKKHNQPLTTRERVCMHIHTIIYIYKGHKQIMTNGPHKTCSESLD